MYDINFECILLKHWLAFDMDI